MQAWYAHYYVETALDYMLKIMYECAVHVEMKIKNVLNTEKYWIAHESGRQIIIFLHELTVRFEKE